MVACSIFVIAIALAASSIHARPKPAPPGGSQEQSDSTTGQTTQGTAVTDSQHPTHSGKTNNGPFDHVSFDKMTTQPQQQPFSPSNPFVQQNNPFLQYSSPPFTANPVATNYNTPNYSSKAQQDISTTWRPSLQGNAHTEPFSTKQTNIPTHPTQSQVNAMSQQQSIFDTWKPPPQTAFPLVNPYSTASFPQNNVNPNTSSFSPQFGVMNNHHQQLQSQSTTNVGPNTTSQQTITSSQSKTPQTVHSPQTRQNKHPDLSLSLSDSQEEKKKTEKQHQQSFGNRSTTPVNQSTSGTRYGGTNQSTSDARYGGTSGSRHGESGNATNLGSRSTTPVTNNEKRTYGQRLDTGIDQTNTLMIGAADMVGLGSGAMKLNSYEKKLDKKLTSFFSGSSKKDKRK